MKAEAQRVAIAEACGWKRTKEGAKSAWFNPAHRGHGRSMFRNQVPDYPTDLNACHEMEKVLTESQCFDYRDRLQVMVLKPVARSSHDFVFHADAPRNAAKPSCARSTSGPTNPRNPDHDEKQG